ncbi:hypothetical protein B0H14DRAFT_2568118 [Mycena olivaceomarginata]|nr:hypothetical protein B0H14DRAFT_2568118 [Mycena olivaceomarginata]
MPDHPSRALGDSADLDYTTFAFDQSVHSRIQSSFGVITLFFSRMTHYFFIAGVAVLIYDHLLTLGAEVKLIWSSKLRSSTGWFLAVRYIALSANVAVGVYNFGNLDHELRPDAMGMGCAAFITGDSDRGGRPSCMGNTRRSLTYREWLDVMQYIAIATVVRPAGAWGAILVCDILVFVLTIRRGYIQGGSPLYAGSLIQRMVTDGKWAYFLFPRFPESEVLLWGCVGSMIIILANLANVLTFYLGDVGPLYTSLPCTLDLDDTQGLITGFLSWFTTSLSVTLLSRLMLNLHEAGVAQIDTNTLNIETMWFATTQRTSMDDEY